MKALIIGTGISGKSVNRLLKKQGYRTFIFDDRKCNLELVRDRLFDGLSLVIVSPGVCLENEVVKLAKEKGIEVVGELEYASRFLSCDYIAITGTNGKTTTTSLVYDLFDKVLCQTYKGGNIGIPVSSFALDTEKEDKVVLEVSSFQLETIKTFKPKVACLLNITPDHLNRHKTMQNYIQTKMKIFENQTNEDYAILNFDKKTILKKYFPKIKSQIYYFSTKNVCKGCYSKNGSIYFNDGTESKFIMKTSAVPLAGEHNLANALASLLSAILYGETNFDHLRNMLTKFKGVSHRLEFVKEIGGVSFINDSKATNIDSTIVAMKAMSEPTTLILGGSDKGFDFDELFDNFPKIIKNIIVIGQTQAKIIASATKKGVSNVYEAKSLKDAVFLGYSLSKKGETVLLSPACASYDMFKNFEQRGKVFVKVVRELERVENRKISNKKTKKV